MPYAVTVQVKELLSRRHITAYQLVKVSRGRLSRNTIYALATGTPERIDLNSLAMLAELIEEVSEQPVELTELLNLERTE